MRYKHRARAASLLTPVNTRPAGIGLYKSLTCASLESNGAFTAIRRRFRLGCPKEIAVSDLIYLAVGVGCCLVFVGYAVLLRRT